jgi:hypothetical protein
MQDYLKSLSLQNCKETTLELSPANDNGSTGLRKNL